MRILVYAVKQNLFIKTFFTFSFAFSIPFLAMFYIHLTFLLSCHQILLKNRLYYSVRCLILILHTPLLYSLSVDTSLKTDEMGIILNILSWNTSFLDKSKYQKFICFFSLFLVPPKLLKVQHFDLYSKQHFSHCNRIWIGYKTAYYKNIIDWRISNEYSKFKDLIIKNVQYTFAWSLYHFVI